MGFSLNKKSLIVFILVCLSSLGYAGVSTIDTEVFAVDFNDLTPEQYEEMIEISSSVNQSFD